MRIKLRKLWNGLASVRDYVVRDCINGQAEGLILEYDGEVMTIKHEELRQRMFQAHHRKNRSRFNPAQSYELIDFKFIPDAKRQELLEKSVDVILEKIKQDKRL